MNEFNSPFKRDFENLIRVEGLDLLEDLMTASTFEEVPICSRDARLSFLGDLPPASKNRLLVQAARWYLGVIIKFSESYFAGRAYDYFCMLSVTDWESFEEDDLVRVSFWHTNPSRGILGYLEFEPPRSKYSAFVADALDRDPSFDIFEGLSDLPDGPSVERVYARPRIFAVGDSR